MTSIAAGEGAVDLADPRYRSVWLSHPVIGDPSYDAFVRFEGNPIYSGSAPYEWPVNGSLFKDPKTQTLYGYVSLYPKGYWPAGPTRLLRSRDQGKTWDDLGLVLQGNKDCFDGDGARGGATCDVTVAAGADGYHMAYGWAKPDNRDGGIAYAFATSPEGPFARDPTPIHAESAQPLLPPGYKRVYASTLIRRANDWMILASMSTPGNAGGMWAFVGMTAPAARGPYSAPILLRAPQQGHWQPQPIEFFPAFVHEGFVYAPLTSVAANRGYQVIYRAPLEEAHRPEAWSVWQAGSLFHAENHPWEAHGIWGQAFAAIVDDGLLRIMYPSRNAEGNGTINLALRHWDAPYRNGFWIAAPNGPAFGLALRRLETFRLDATFEAHGLWQLVWNYRGPLGPDRATADATISPLSWRSMTSLSVKGNGWTLREVTADGTHRELACGPVEGGWTTWKVTLVQAADRMELRVNDLRLCDVHLPPQGGGIGLVAETGTYLHVRRFALDTLGGPGSWFLLPLEGLLGAGDTGRQWAVQEEGFRYRTGYVATFDGARAKWNFQGRKVQLWAPRGPEYGEGEILLDGAHAGRVAFHADKPRESAVVWTSKDLPEGPHALMLLRARGPMPVDCAEFFP